jgi:hydrogenase maturation protease
MIQPKTRCLILACGNTLRGDDGLGPCLARWAEERFKSEPALRILSRPQWTPELAEEVAQAESVLFIDCSVDSAPGSIQLLPVEPAATAQGLGTHHAGAAELLAMAREFYNSLPRTAQQLTIGAGSTELGEQFSPAVTSALPESCRLLEDTVLRFLNDPETSPHLHRP